MEIKGLGLILVFWSTLAECLELDRMMTLMVIILVAIILVKESGFDSDGDGDYINQSAWIWIG